MNVDAFAGTRLVCVVTRSAVEEAAGCFVVAVAARGNLGKSARLIEKLSLVQAASGCSENEVTHWC